jgi:ribosomal protein S18 acetylase RimI-like enzyme
MRWIDRVVMPNYGFCVSRGLIYSLSVLGSARGLGIGEECICD